MSNLSEAQRGVLWTKFRPWIGRRVTVGLASFHYLAGTWNEIDPDTDEAVFSIDKAPYRVGLNQVVSVQPSPTSQADFFK